jgi:hypothetical protein
MFSESDKLYVIESLTRQVALSGRPREALVVPFPGTTFPEDLIEGSPRELATSAINLCIADGWKHDPTWMLLLLENFQLLTIDARVAEIWERSRHQPPPAADPLARSILNNIPFINRTTLRKQLAVLETPAAEAQPILVVNGNDKSGKSYSTNYIEYYSDVRKSVTTYRIPLEPGTELETSAKDIAQDMVYLMSRPLNGMPQYDGTNLKRSCKELVNWVLSEASQTPSQHWFVLDNFRENNLRPDVREFLLVLSDQITNGIFKRKCRLILIGTDRAMLTVDPGRIEEEIIKPCNLEDITKAVEEILERAAPYSLTLQTMMDFVVTGLPADKSKMETLNWRLRVLLTAIVKLKDILSKLPGANFETVLLQTLADLPPGRPALQQLQERLNTLSESTNAM